MNTTENKEKGRENRDKEKEPLTLVFFFMFKSKPDGVNVLWGQDSQCQAKLALAYVALHGR
jgi:hypothetical protein